jgi:MFS family permease
VFFNARWYYPVLAVLFLDFGLTMEQYALLNVAWAAAIVGLEVPSGALADQIGRRRMVMLAAAIMVVELALLVFAPRGAAWLFPIFLLNRVLSGAAEACASGADEALAYDSLTCEGRGAEWPRVLERLMRWQSAAFFVAMMAGGALYDGRFLTRALGVDVPQVIAMRLPLAFTLGNAVVALACALAMREPPMAEPHEPVTARGTWRATLATGAWLLATPAALVVILAGLCFDSIIRLFLTVASNYYRLIALPEWAFGLIGSGFAVIGFLTPRLSRWLVDHRSQRANFALVAALTLTGLTGAALAITRWGLALIAPLGVAMSLLGFFVSHYLNEAVTDSRRRATVLSFRGLAFNLAYGGVGLLFAALSRALRSHGPPEVVFAEALRWLPGYFVATAVLLAIAAARLRRISPVRE